MLLLLPGRKHAAKPLFAHKAFSEEVMLLCGLEVRALLPGVAPRLAFDNSEQQVQSSGSHIAGFSTGQW